MNTNGRLVAMGLVLCVAQAVSTGQAATYNWNKGGAGGTFDWNANANWLPNTGYPNAVDDVAKLEISHYNPVTINLNVPIIVGTLSLYVNDKVWYIYPGAAGALTFASTGPTALLSHNSIGGPDTIGATITLSSDLLVDNNGGWVRGFGVYNNSYREGLLLTSVISGARNLTKTGYGGLWLDSTANTFQGDIKVQQGWLLPANFGAGLGNAANPIVLGSTGTIGRLLARDSGSTLTRSLTLTGGGGGFGAWGNCNLGTSITGKGLLLLDRGSAAIIFNNTTDNTYSGPTRVHQAYVDVRTTNRVFTGNTRIQYYGYLRLLTNSNVGGSVRVDGLSLQCPALQIRGRLGIKGNNFFPTLDPASSGGILSLESNSTAAIEAAWAAGAPQLGNGYLHYGSHDGRVFYGASLQPNLDKVYRFTPSGTLYLDRSGSTVGVLTDVGGPCSVEINGWAMANGNQTVYTSDANDFTGTLTVNPGANFSGEPRTTGSPFGANGGTVNLNAGALLLQNPSAGSVPISKGTLNLQGQCCLWLVSAAHQILLTFDTVNRSNRAQLAVGGATGTPPGSNMGGTERIVISNGVPAPVNGMVPPWIIAMQAPGVNYFVNYTANGFTQAAFTATSLATAGATDIVNLNSGDTVPSGGKTVYAVRTAGPLVGAAGDKLTIASGGLILDGSGANNNLPNAMNHTADIDFGGAEGVIWNSGANNLYHCNQLSGKLYGSNGLTIGGPIYGNHTPVVYITNDNTATLTGQITINEGRVLVSSTGLGNTNNPVLINSCGVMCNADNRGATLGGISNNTCIYNSITLGPNGGTIENGYNGRLHIYGKVTGPGGLAVAGHHDTDINLYSPHNDWAGGTWVVGCNLKVQAGSKLGPGDVMVGGINTASMLHLYDPNAISPTARVAILIHGPRDCDQIWVLGAGATWGSLEGNGHVIVDYAGHAPLTIGGNNASTEFFGRIADRLAFSAGRYASLTKVGTGTFTMWGECLYAGTTTVARGTMLVNGLVKGVAIADGTAGSATLGGSGFLASNVVVRNGATLAPGFEGQGVLTIGRDLTFDSASTYAVTLGGTNATVDFGQLSVGGTVALNNATLALTLTSVPAVGQKFLIMDNPAGATVTGTFAGGRIVSCTHAGKTYYFHVNYTANDGNDVELTALPQGTFITIR